MKRIMIIIVILLISYLGINSAAYAQLQFGIEAQSQNNEFTFDTLQANWWFQKNIALRGDFSWNEQNIGVGILYELDPDNTLSPYLGIAEYDLARKAAPEASWEQKMMIITGMEWNLSKLKPGLSINLEAKGGGGSGGA